MAKPVADKFYDVETDGGGTYDIVLVERKTTLTAWAQSRAAADKIVQALNEHDNL